MNLFVHEIDAVPYFVVSPDVASLLLGKYREAAGIGSPLHRTPMRDVKGDALDQVEVEMVNDALYKDSTRLFEDRSQGAAAMLEAAVGSDPGTSCALSLHEGAIVDSFVTFLNAVHVHLSRNFTNADEVGTAMEEVPILAEADNPLDLILKQAVALMLSELMELWANSF